MQVRHPNHQRPPLFWPRVAGRSAVCCLAALAALATVATAQAQRSPHATYRLHSRFWLPYQPDVRTLALYRLDRDAPVDLEEVLDLDSLAEQTAAPGLLDGLGGAPQARASARADQAVDSGIVGRHADLVGSYAWSEQGWFGGGLRLENDGALVSGPHSEIGGRQPFTAECWVRLADQRGGLLLSVDAQHGAAPAFALDVAPDGALRAWILGNLVATSEVKAKPAEWMHVALIATPARTVPGQYRFVARQLGPQLILRVNGQEVLVHEHAAVDIALERMAKTIRFGASRGATAAAATFDEARVSNELREFYDLDLGWIDPVGARPLAVGQPYFRNEADCLLAYQPLAAARPAEWSEADPAAPALQPGVHGHAILVGGGKPAPQFPFEPGALGNQGTIEFWFRPFDWDNRREQTFHDPMEFVPLIHGRAAEKADPVLRLAIHHKLPQEKPRPPIVHPGEWYHVVAVWRGGTRRLYLNGKPMHDSLGTFTAPAADDASITQLSLDPATARLAYTGVGTLINGLRVYSRPLTPIEVANAHARYRPDLELRPLPFAHLQVAMNHPEQWVGVEAELLDPRGGQVAQVAFDGVAPDGSAAFQLGPVAVVAGRAAVKQDQLPVGFGTYRVRCRYLDADGQEIDTQEIEVDRPAPPWFQTTVGIRPGEVLPGWEPLVVEGKTLNLAARRIEFADSGLPTRLHSRGADLLASPIRLLAETAAGPLALQPSATLQVLEAAPDRVVTAGTLEGEGVQIATRTTTEFDGMMKVEITVTPGAALTLQSLRLETPFLPERAVLYGFWTGNQNFRASTRFGLLPGTDGQVFTSLNPGRARSKEIRGSFIPYLHLGDDHRMLAWFAENDRHWTISDDTPAVEILRLPSETVLRLNLLSQPTVLDQPVTYVFGWHLSPTKPLPQRSRSRVYEANFAWVDSFSKQALKADGNWGNFNLYPQDYDWEAAAARAAVHATHYGNERGYRGAYLYLDRNWVGLPGNASEFAGRWWASGYYRYLPEATDCYVWHVNEWLRRGIVPGIYIDDVWIGTFRDLRSGLAYKLPDGAIQPGFEFFDYREALKRMRWAFHENDLEPFIWLHMTETYYLPILSFADLILDGESRFPDWGSKQSFIGAWGLPHLRHNQGDKWGLIPIWMNKIGNDKPAPTPMPHWFHRQVRYYHAGLALSDLRNAAGTLPDFEKAGLYRDDVSFVGYWEPNNPLQPQTEGALASLYRDPKSVSVVIVDSLRGEQPRVLSFAIDAAALGIGAKQAGDLRIEDVDSFDPPAGEDISRLKPPAVPKLGEAVVGREDALFDLLDEIKADAERDPTVFVYDAHNFQFENGILTLQVQPHDYRLLRITRKP